MKHTLTLFMLVMLSLPARAQWVDGGFPSDYQVLAFGIHDTSLFLSYPYLDPYHRDSMIYIYTPVSHWTGFGKGLDPTQGNITSFASLGQYFFAGINANGPIVKSLDNGNTWEGGIRADNPILVNAGYLFAWADTTGVAMDSHIRRSSDSGKTWGVYSELSLHVIAYGANGSYVLASCQEGLYRSTDNGGTWNPVTTPLSNISCFAAVGTAIYAANGTQLMVSADSGAKWDTMSTGFPVSLLATNGVRLFAGGDSGVCLLGTDGQTWTNESDTGIFRGHGVVALGVFDTLLFADFNIPSGREAGYYLYMRSIPEMTDSTKSEVVTIAPNADTLSIYLNPASGVITIMSSEPILSISVNNLLGTNIISIPKEEGENYTLDLSKEPTGIYFLYIHTQSGTVIKKVAIER